MASIDKNTFLQPQGRKQANVLMKRRKVGIGFVTGRKNFKNVLETYINSWGAKVLSADEAIDISLFVAYDLEYNNTSRSDYININVELRETLSDIYFIDRTTVVSQAYELKTQGVLTEDEAALFFEKGYAGKRNAILYCAVKNGIEALLFLDDDEYPIAVQKHSGMESWTGQQILATHLKYIDGADITNGHHCGYISPIPTLTFNDILTETDFRTFIEAISNDIINWDNVKLLMEHGNITYADSSVISGAPTEVAEQNYTKFISGSNLCINLKTPRNVSPFFNPPMARGEDTFLSTCLSDKTVLRVPCYAFHDGFSAYTSLLKGVLPQKLQHISGNAKRHATRFYQTCMGWIRYKPLLLYITDRDNYRHRIVKMKADLAFTLPKLSEYFQDPKFMNIVQELDKYDQAVEKHYQAFLLNQNTWNKLALYLLR